MSNKLPENEENQLQNHFNQLMRSMDHFFNNRSWKGFLNSMDDLFAGPLWFGGFPVDLEENESEYIITAQLAGVKKDQINIDIFQRYITITIQHDEEITQKDDKYDTFQKKQSFQRSSRTIPLASPIDEQNVTADFQDGLLTLTIPKIKGKTIKIK